MLLSPWHTLLAVMRLPKCSLQWELLMTLEHIAVLYPIGLLYLAVLAPNSAALSWIVRITMYLAVGRADVDIGPTMWHLLFIFFLLYSLLVLCAVMWVHVTGKSMIQYVERRESALPALPCCVPRGQAPKMLEPPTPSPL